MLLRPGYRPVTAITRKLVGWWPFDDGGSTGTILDKSGSRNHATYAGGAFRTSNGFGRSFGYGPPGALNLASASSQYADCVTDTSFDPSGGLTYSLWWNAATFPASDGYIGLMERRVDAANFIVMYIKSATGKLAYYCGNGSNAAIDPGSLTSVTGVWNHSAMTYDSSGGLVGYFNGAIDASTANVSAMSASPAHVHVGEDSAATRFFNGRIRDVRVYGRALSAAEIRAIYLEAWQPLPDIETIALMGIASGGGGFTPKFRKTLSMYGSGVGKRQGQAA